MIRFNKWIGAVSKQEFQQFQIAGLGRANERRCPGFDEPLHREDGSRECIVLRLSVGIGSVIQKEFDELEMIDIRLRYGEIAAFDVPVIRREIKPSPLPF